MIKHTKWTIVAMVLALVLLAACTSDPKTAPSTVSSLPVSQSASISPVPSSAVPASVGDASEVQTNEPAATLPEDFGGVRVSGDGVDRGDQVLRIATLTKEQKNAIVTLVQNVLDGYRESWLPLPVIPESEYYLNDPLPDGVTLPQTVAFEDLSLVEVMERTQIMAGLPLSGGHTLRVGISLAHVADDDYTGYKVFITNAKIEPAA